jgi:hypothetical protein
MDTAGLRDALQRELLRADRGSGCEHEVATPMDQPGTMQRSQPIDGLDVVADLQLSLAL